MHNPGNDTGGLGMPDGESGLLRHMASERIPAGNLAAESHTKRDRHDKE